ncbi:MAG TPA: O-antigen ligase family protein [Candidatus Acidoferrum sp.]|nr:O-antigen ligase family protein [Candidatus Acidoferrum sp.]
MLLFAGGFAMVFVADLADRVESHGLQVLSGMGLVKGALLLIGGLAATYLLVRYAEITLALFFLIGLIKGDERLASMPVDLTVTVGGLVIFSVCAKVITGKRELALPREYLLYLPMLAMMILSLAYTPDLSGGVDKTLRFLCLTSIGIISPFVLFDSVGKLKNFFLAMALGGLAIAVNSLAMLGGSDRLVSPSGLNTELGAASAISMIVIWSLWFPEWPVMKRALFYPVLGVLGVALIGSGGRFANVAAVLCLVLATFLRRKLFVDVAVIGGLGVLLLPLIWIPQASFDYLGSLAHPPQAMGTRNDLMALGVKMFSEHPFLGVGIQGFRFLSPNPLTYNYPHNLFLELGAELGLLAALSFLALAACAFHEIWKQLRDPEQSRNSPVLTVFLLLLFAFLDAMVSGDINDLRFMWFVFGLPYVLRAFEASRTFVVLSDTPATLAYASECSARFGS